MILKLKQWFNQRYSYYRRCLYSWCLREQTYQHRCHLHQYDLSR